jgi:hypothetical protein
LHEVVVVSFVAKDFICKKLGVENAFTCDADWNNINIIFAQHWALDRSGNPFHGIIALLWSLNLSLSALSVVLVHKGYLVIYNGFFEECLVHVVNGVVVLLVTFRQVETDIFINLCHQIKTPIVFQAGKEEA